MSPIEDKAVTNARIGEFNPDELAPEAKRHWDLLCQRLKAMEEYDARHPLLSRLEMWPLVGRWYRAKRRSWVIRAVPLLFLLLLFSACTFPAWRDKAYRDLLAGRLQFDSSQVSPGGSPSSYVDFYDRSGRRLGYGIVRDGWVDMYGPRGNRLGYGRQQ